MVGPGTAWLAECKPHDVLDVIGPIGRSFQYPRELRSCLLVGGGYGAAPLHFLAEAEGSNRATAAEMGGPTLRRNPNGQIDANGDEKAPKADQDDRPTLKRRDN